MISYIFVVADLVAVSCNVLCRRVVKKSDLKDLPAILVNDPRKKSFKKRLAFHAQDYCESSVHRKLYIYIY